MRGLSAVILLAVVCCGVARADDSPKDLTTYSADDLSSATLDGAGGSWKSEQHTSSYGRATGDPVADNGATTPVTQPVSRPARSDDAPPWIVALIATSGLIVAIIAAAMVSRRWRSRRAWSIKYGEDPQFQRRRRSSSSSVLAARLIQANQHAANSPNTMEPETIPTRRAA